MSPLGLTSLRFVLLGVAIEEILPRLRVAFFLGVGFQSKKMASEDLFFSLRMIFWYCILSCYLIILIGIDVAVFLAVILELIFSKLKYKCLMYCSSSNADYSVDVTD